MAQEYLNAERSKATEAYELHNNKKSTKRLGHLLIERESIKKSKDLSQQNKKEIIEKLKNKRISSLNRSEVIDLSGKISVDGSSLRQIYETHLIGENALRRLLEVYLKSGNVKETLKNEIIEKEKDFERDPVVRDLPSITSDVQSSNGGLNVFDDFVKKANSSLLTNTEEPAFFKAKSNYELKQSIIIRHQKKIINSIIITVVALLFIIFLVSYLANH